MNIKKMLIGALCLLVIVGMSAMGTMAYLMDQSDATVNTFTMGNVNITLDETKVDVYGKPVMTKAEDGSQSVAERTSAGNVYRMIPGQTYTKDPTITVTAGSEESYVRMMVQVSSYDVLQKIFGDKFTLDKFVTCHADWVVHGDPVVSSDGKTVTYEFRYKNTVDGMDDGGEAVDVKLPALFKEFSVPEEFNINTLKSLDGFKITVEGHAIQAMGFDEVEGGGKTPEQLAWEAFAAESSSKGSAAS